MPPDTLPAAPLSTTQKQKVPFHTGAEPFLGLVGASKHAFPAYAGGTREARRHWEVFLAFPPYTGTEPSKARASRLDGFPSGIRRNLFLNHRHALRNLHYNKKRTRLITGTPPDTFRRPLSATQKQNVPFRHTPGRNLSLGSWGRQSTHSRHTPEEPVRQDGFGKSFWHSRRTPGRNRPKRRLPGLMGSLPAYGGISSLTIGTRYPTFTTAKKREPAPTAVIRPIPPDARHDNPTAAVWRLQERLCHSLWLFYFSSMLKIETFSPIFRLTDSIAKTFC